MLATLTNTYRTIAWNDGTIAVLESDTTQPQKMEVIAIFYKEERADAYASSLTREGNRIAALANFVPEGPVTETERQEEVTARQEDKTTFQLNEQHHLILKLLIQNKNEGNEVAMSQGDIAKKTGISPGSVYNALRRMVNLEALELIRTGANGKPSVFKIANQLCA